MRYRQLLYTGVVVATAGTAYATLSAAARSTSAARDPKRGMISASEVIERTSEVARKLAQIAGEPAPQVQVTPYRETNPFPIWQVTVGGHDREPIAKMDVNGNTGEIWCVSFASPRQPKGAGRKLARAEAIDTSWWWLRSLGFANGSQKWHVSRAVIGGHGDWVLHWRTTGRSATIRLRIRSGDMVTAWCWRPADLPGSRTRTARSLEHAT